MDLATLIQRARLARRRPDGGVYTQTDLAGDTGIERTLIVRIESGDAAGSTATLLKLVAWLGLDAAEALAAHGAWVPPAKRSHESTGEAA